jgi:amino acid transporter
MIFSIALLIVIVFIAFKISPVENKEHAHIHGAGQIGLLAAIALFGVDYFTSYFYATGEMMSALHPYNLQKYAFIAVAFIAIANAVFGFLYMYSLGVFNEGGGSYTASMRYLAPGLSLVVAVVLLQDYIFTIVVSSLSGVDQLLSLKNAYNIPWIYHVAIGIGLVTVTWWLTIRGRGESARVVFTMLGIFILLTIAMAVGLFMAKGNGAAALPYTPPTVTPTIWKALYHMLTASMKGLVALSGLEAMSNGIQFVINEDFSLVKWGKKHLPRLSGLWNYYSGKSGIGRMVQTSFLFYGGITTTFLTYFAIHFNAFDSVAGRSLVANLSFIGFSQIPGGTILYWAYQILAVGLLAAASMTAFQDLQATEWRDVAIGEIPEIIVYRDKRGTFTRSVTIAYIVVIIITFVIRGKTALGIPYYGIGVFMPIMMMGFAVRRHILKTYPKGAKRTWGALGAGFAAILSGFVFVGQIVGKWTEGGWIVLISFTILAVTANLVLISPIGQRVPTQIHRIVREKARVQGAMASIVEWQSMRMQEYRYNLLVAISRFWQLFGINRPVRYEPPAPAGDYNHALHVDHPDAPSLLEQYLDSNLVAPKVGGAPRQTAAGNEEGKEE